MKIRRNALVALFFWVSASIVSACFAQTQQPAASARPIAARPVATSSAALLDINSASEEELRALKGVGDKRAAEIVKNRPYRGKDELVQKKIIPASVYAGIKDKIIAKQN